GGGDQTVSLEDLLVGGGTECTVRLFLRGDSAVPGSGGTDSDCGSDGFGVLDGCAVDQRSRTGCLDAEHAGLDRGQTVRVVLGVSAPVRGDVSCVSDRESVHV